MKEKNLEGSLNTGRFIVGGAITLGILLGLNGHVTHRINNSGIEIYENGKIVKKIDDPKEIKIFRAKYHIPQDVHRVYNIKDNF